MYLTYFIAGLFIEYLIRSIVGNINFIYFIDMDSILICDIQTSDVYVKRTVSI